MTSREIIIASILFASIAAHWAVVSSRLNYADRFVSQNREDIVELEGRLERQISNLQDQLRDHSVNSQIHGASMKRLSDRVDWLEVGQGRNEQ